MTTNSNFNRDEALRVARLMGARRDQIMKFNLVEYRWNEEGVTRPSFLDEKVIASFDSAKEADAACDSALDTLAYHDESVGVSYFYEEVDGDDSPLSGLFADELPSSDYWGA